MTAKTNVIRLLEAQGVTHRVHVYDPALVTSAEGAAALVGVEPERIFKTLVASGGGTLHLVFCLPSVLELDLRRAAAVSGARRVDLVRPDELQPLTGYLRGGCSPLAMKKALPSFLDETAGLFTTILISGGLRGVHVELAPQDLLAVGRLSLPRFELAALT